MELHQVRMFCCSLVMGKVCQLAAMLPIGNIVLVESSWEIRAMVGVLDAGGTQ